MKAREIAELVGGDLRGDGDVEIVSVSDFSTAGPEQIAFIEKPDDELTTNAAKHGALSSRDGRISVRWHRVMNGNFA